MTAKLLVAAAILAALWMLWRRARRPEAMAPAEARATLGLPADADADEVRAAHRRLIARNHPDTGGSPALAARINAARDVLLREIRKGRS